MQKQQSKHGTLETKSELDRSKLEHLRKVVATDLAEFPDLASDWSLLRFLRARDFDINRTSLMLHECCNFRRQNDFYSSLKHPYDYFETINKYYYSGFCNYDYEGHPVIVEEVAKSKPDMILGHIPEKMILEYIIQKNERILHTVLPAMSRIKGKRIDQIVMIADLKDAGMSILFQSKVQAYLKLMLTVGQNCYPEILVKSYVVNAPFLFKGIWSIIKGMMDARTVAKFCIESGNGLKTLSQVMDIGFLPVSMGGKYTGKMDYFNGPWRAELEESWAIGSSSPKDRSAEVEYFGTIVSALPPIPQESVPKEDQPQKKQRADSEHIPSNGQRSGKEINTTFNSQNQSEAASVHSSRSVKQEMLTHLDFINRQLGENKTMIGNSSDRKIEFSRPGKSKFSLLNN